MNTLLITIIFFLGRFAFDADAKGCGCQKSLDILTTSINGKNLKAAASNIMLNIYDSAKTVLKSFEFEVLEIMGDQYSSKEEPCFNANAGKVRISHEGNEYFVSLEISGIAFDDRIETSICRCQELGANPLGNFCSVILPEAIQKRQEVIKCHIENNCQSK